MTLVEGREHTASDDAPALSTKPSRRVWLGVGGVIMLVVAVTAALLLRTDPARVVTNAPTATGADPVESIRTAIEVLFEPGHSAVDKLAQVDDSGDLSYVITKGMTDPRAPVLTLTVTAVEVAGESATAHIDFFIQGGLAMKDARLGMVRVGDRWLAQHASYCALVETSGPPCPREDRLSPDGPTRQAIADVMARTVLATDHTRHFAPNSADSPVVVTDGTSGTLTAARGFVTDTNDPTEGQLVFLWHNDQFLGWATSQLVLGLELHANDATSINVTYGYMKPGEGACCLTGQDPVVYHWDGTKVVADRDPLAQDFFGTVELLPA